MQWDSSALTLGTLRKAKALRDTARSATREKMEKAANLHDPRPLNPESAAMMERLDAHMRHDDKVTDAKGEIVAEGYGTDH